MASTYLCITGTTHTESFTIVFWLQYQHLHMSTTMPETVQILISKEWAMNVQNPKVIIFVLYNIYSC